MFLGIDLAWAARNRTGLAVLDDDGRFTGSAVVRSDDEIDAWLQQHAPDAHVIGVDAPLVVTNDTGSRAAERELNRAFSSLGAGAYPVNRTMPWFAPPRGEALARRHSWSVDPADASAPLCLEVYPHAALVGLFGLPRRVLYKKGPDRRAGFLQLVELLESVRTLALARSTRWRQLRSIIEKPARGDLTRIEDEIDAVVCAWVAWLWHHEPDRLRTYGSVAEGFIVAPPRPESR